MFDYNSILIGHQCPFQCYIPILLRARFSSCERNISGITHHILFLNIYTKYFHVIVTRVAWRVRGDEEKKKEFVKTNWYFVGSFTLHFFFRSLHFIRLRHEIVAWTSYYYNFFLFNKNLIGWSTRTIYLNTWFFFRS